MYLYIDLFTMAVPDRIRYMFLYYNYIDYFLKTKKQSRKICETNLSLVYVQKCYKTIFHI